MLNTAKESIPAYDMLLYALKGGVKHQEVQCMHCKGTSERSEPCPELSLDFPDSKLLPASPVV